MKSTNHSGRHLFPDGYLKSGESFWTLPDGNITTDYGEWVVVWMKLERD